MTLQRLLDANANRAAEALRTVEDYARFLLNDAARAEALKRLRHEIPAWRAAFSAAPAGAADGLEAAEAPADDAALLSARDTPGDVGTVLKTSAEAERSDAAAVARAGVRRAAEALRVLSEFGKVGAPAAAAACEAARYTLYSLEPYLFVGVERRKRLATATVQVLITERFCSAPPEIACREAVAGGADVIQMREKDLEDAAFLERALALREICHAGGALLVINDRAHIARLIDADGAHTGQGDLPPALARRLLGPDRLLGKSTGAPAFAEQALADGCDYIGVGPVFETNTKQHRAAAGLEYVRWIAGWNRLKYFAIGSVNRNTVDEVLAAGARSLAICTAVTQARDIAEATRFFKTRLAEAGA